MYFYRESDVCFCVYFYRESDVCFCVYFYRESDVCFCVYFYRESDVCFCVYFSEKKIKHDTYLVPYAHLELALMAMADGRDEDAKKLLHKARYVHKNTLH